MTITKRIPTVKWNLCGKARYERQMTIMEKSIVQIETKPQIIGEFVENGITIKRYESQ